MSLNKEILDKILLIKDLKIEIDKDLSTSSTFKLLARGDLITIESEQAGIELIKIFYHYKIKYRILGLGANQIIPQTSTDPYLKLHLDFDKNILKEEQNEIDVPASLSIHFLTQYATKFGLKGWEVFTGIPATVGGAIFMNAGTALGEFGSIVKEVRILRRDGKIENLMITPKDFSYRKNHFLKEGDLLLKAKLIHFGLDQKIAEIIKKYLQYRLDTQPLWSKTCGCMFKNAKINIENNSEGAITCPVGKYIDIIGLKGLEVNGVRISHKHGNFFENTGNGTYQDVLKLMEAVKNELYLNFGIEFEAEVEF